MYNYFKSLKYYLEKEKLKIPINKIIGTSGIVAASAARITDDGRASGLSLAVTVEEAVDLLKL